MDTSGFHDSGARGVLEKETPIPEGHVPPFANEELVAYLTSAGMTVRQDWFGGSDEKVLGEFKRFLAEGKTPKQFYTDGEIMLYHFTHIGDDMWLAACLKALIELFPPPKKVLDFGCGVGAIGLKLATQGYAVSFEDFDTVCTRYLKWRLAWRQQDNPQFPDCPVYDEHDDIPKHDVAFAFDVMGRVKNPLSLLSKIEPCADVVVFNLLKTIPPEADASEPRTHYYHDPDALFEKIAEEHEVIEIRDLGDRWAWLMVYKS